MRNIWRLFTGDLRRLRANMMTVITVIGLIALPSIFSWYNMLACWDVFENTGNLTVAVANNDAGYESDLVPLRVNIGDQVTKALRENDQLNWVFTNSDDAVDGARSGRYYAAVVIPDTFSRDMMSFYSADVEHASIIYYSNEKKNAVAPKVTDQGADQISRQINQSFAETLSEISLGIASALVKYGDDADINGLAGDIASHMSRVAAEMTDTAKALQLYADVLEPAKALAKDAGTLLADARDAAAQAASQVSGARDAADDVPRSIDDASDALSVALAECAQSYSAIPGLVASLTETATTTSADAAAQLRLSASDIDALASDTRSLVRQLEQLQVSLGDSSDSIASAIERVNSSIDLQQRLSSGLTEAAEDIEATNTAALASRDELKALALSVSKSLDEARIDYDEGLALELERLSDTMAAHSGALSDVGERLSSASGELIGTTDSLGERIGGAQDKIASVARELADAGTKINELGERVAGVVPRGDASTLRDLVGTDPATLAQAIAAPIKIERHAVFPVENFGSAMSPLYTTLALWIGALLIMVTMKVTPTPRSLEGLENPTKRQLFIGRFGMISVLSLSQSTTIALGNLFFLGVQAAHPWLYVLCFWVAGLAFACIIYTLVALLANAGKALGVILLIVQVSGGGGSFPMQVLPPLFQAVSPFLPITHAINAMRAAMFGLYGYDFWTELGVLALFAVGIFAIGVVLAAPLSHFVPKFVERVEASKLM